MREESWRRMAQTYGELTSIPPRYADVDVMRHLNNVAVGVMHLEARMRWLMRTLAPDAWRADGVRLRPRWLATDFLGEGHYPDAVDAGVRCLGVDSEGWDMASGLFQHGTCFGTQHARLSAWCDGMPIALPDAIRHSLQAASQPLAQPGSPAPMAPRPEIGDFAWSVSLQSRFADIDADGHAGEVALSRYMETARILGVRDGVPDLSRALQAEGMGLVVGRVEMTVFSLPRPPRQWHAGVRISRLGTASFTVQCALFARDACVAVSDTVLVSIQRDAMRARALPETAREALAPLIQTALAR